VASAGPTLRQRAVALLARREHSRAELARKLARFAQDPAEIEPVLDELARRRLLSDERFAEARAQSLGARFGAARLEHELRTRGVDAAAIARVTAAARASEIDRARAAWRKRFGGRAPASAAERAKQARFLQGRGFSFEAIRRVVGGTGDGELD
jgi:regulatory protein